MLSFCHHATSSPERHSNTIFLVVHVLFTIYDCYLGRTKPNSFMVSTTSVLGARRFVEHEHTRSAQRVSRNSLL
jgi:hypothetical protein